MLNVVFVMFKVNEKGNRLEIYFLLLDLFCLNKNSFEQDI